MNPTPTLLNDSLSRHTVRGASLALALTTVCGALLLAGCGKSHERHGAAPAELPSVKVRVQPAQPKKITSTEEVVGTVAARLRATLEAKVSGRIQEMPVVLGQKVQAGDLLAKLDAPEIKARVDQAEANLQQAERDGKRLAALFQQQAATSAENDAAESRVLAARAAVAEARAMMAYVEIRAPFDAVVSRKWVDRGDLAVPGKPLVDLQDPTALQMEADVSETIGARIRAEARMAIRIEPLSRELEGTVSEIAPMADPVSRTFRVRLNLPPTPGVQPGQFARLIVPLGETDSLRVPASAVVRRGQMEIVFGVRDQRARLHLVKSGRRLGDELEILSGLDAGDSVVIEGAARLADGQPVEIQ